MIPRCTQCLRAASQLLELLACPCVAQVLEGLVELLQPGERLVFSDDSAEAWALVLRVVGLREPATEPLTWVGALGAGGK